MTNFIRFLFGITLLQIALGLQITNPDDASQTKFTIVVDEGEDVVLKCKVMFEGSENVGTNPGKWHKTQDMSHMDDPEMASEISNLALQSNLFKNEGRFQVDFQMASIAEANLNLAISGVVPEDSGWYFCYSKSGGDVVSVMYQLIVPVDHKEIKLTGTSDGVNASQENSLVFKENVPGMVRCEVSGGYPAATLRVYIEGENNPLPAGTPSNEMVVKGDTVGLQTLTEKSIVQVPVTMRPDQQGQEIVCEVADKPNFKASRVLTVLFAPRGMVCDKDVTANKGDENVIFGCKFASNPAPTSIIWRAGSYVLNISNAKSWSHNEYTASYRVLGERGQSGLSLFETKLSIQQIEMTHFQRYELEIVSGDGLDTVKQEFVLKVGERGETVVGGNSASLPRISISHLIASLVAIIFIKVSLQ